MEAAFAGAVDTLKKNMGLTGAVLDPKASQQRSLEGRGREGRPILQQAGGPEGPVPARCPAFLRRRCARTKQTKFNAVAMQHGLDLAKAKHAADSAKASRSTGAPTPAAPPGAADSRRRVARRCGSAAGRRRRHPRSRETHCRLAPAGSPRSFAGSRRAGCRPRARLSPDTVDRGSCAAVVGTKAILSSQVQEEVYGPGQRAGRNVLPDSDHDSAAFAKAMSDAAPLHRHAGRLRAAARGSAHRHHDQGDRPGSRTTRPTRSSRMRARASSPRRNSGTQLQAHRLLRPPRNGARRCSKSSGASLTVARFRKQLRRRQQDQGR